MTWITRSPRSELEKLTLLWHREIEPGPNGLIKAACGSTFSDPDAVERRDDLPDSGDRCPACSAWRL